MTRSIFSRFAPIALLALAGLGGYACSDSTGPGGGRKITLTIRPTFSVAGAASAVSLKKAHVTVHKGAGTVALDTTVVLSTTGAGRSTSGGAVGASPVAGVSSGIEVSVDVPIGGGSAGEDFTVDVDLLDANGAVLFHGGPANVHGDPGESPPAFDLPSTYVGTGATANRIELTPSSANVLPSGSIDVTARALTASGTELPGTPVLWSSLDPTIASVPNGSTGHVVAGPARGTARIHAMLLTGQTADATITVRPAASALVLQSGNGQSGFVSSAAAQPLVVKVNATDGAGLDGVQVTFAIQSGGGALSATQVTTLNDGTASVNYTFGQAAGSVTVTATVTGLIGSPVSFTLTGTASTPSQLAFTTQPVNGFVGTPLAPVVVEARDQFGNKLTSFTGSVSLGLSAPANSLAQLTGTTTVSAVAGVATFSNLSVSAAAATLQLIASATGVANNATSTAFAVTVRPAVALVFTTQPPPNIPAGDVMPDLVVQARDAVGGLVTSYSGLVTIVLDGGPPGATLLGQITSTAVNGVAVFNGVNVSAPAPSVRISAVGTGITGTFFSSTFIVGTPSSPFVASPPSTSFTVVRTAASPAPATVQITATSAPVTGMTVGTITYTGGPTGWLAAVLSVGTTPSVLTLTPTTPALPEGTFTATVPITGSAGASMTYSVTLTVTPLPVSELFVVTDPAGAAVGAPFVTQPVIELRDATHTRVLSATNIVTATVGSGPGTIGGTVALNAIAGRVTYTNLRINTTGGAHTLTFTAAGPITPITSASFNVGPALSTTAAIPATVGDNGVLIPPFTPVTAAGGIAPYTFALGGAVLPTGMNFNTTNGQVTGTPTTNMGTTVFTVTVTDATLTTSQKTFTLTVNPALTTTQAIAARVGDNGTAIPAFIPVTTAGGTAPVVLSLSGAGDVAALAGVGLTFTPATGAINGTPTATLALRTFTVTATDNIGVTSSKTFTLTINAALSTTQAVPAKVGTQGAAIASYVPVTAAGGTPAITFALTGAGDVGALAGIGLTFTAATGAVSGTPAAPLAVRTFTVTATDAIGATSSNTFQLTVNPPLTTTQAVPATVGNQGTPIAITPVTAAGGTAPITFAVVPLATLTGIGLVYNVNTGALSGTPTGPIVLTTFTVTATDAAGATSVKTFTLTVNGPLTTTQAIPAKVGTQGANIPSFIPVTAAGGTAPITFSLTGAGDVAALAGTGLTFTAATGAISGTPTAPLATRTFTVTATDAVPTTSSQTFSLTINPPLTTTQAVPATVGTQGTLIPTFTPVTAAGGTVPITFALTGAGDAAALAGIGMTFTAATGAVSGTPTAPLATRSFTVTATDAAGATSNKTFSLTVNGPVTTTLVIPTKVGDNGTAIPSFIPVTAAGGTAPVAFALTGAGDNAALLGVGLTFTAATGAISGTPTAPLATRTFTVTATDFVGSNSSKNFDLTINAALTTTQAIPTKVGDNGVAILSFIPVTAAGGTPAITFALTGAGDVAALAGVGLTFTAATGAIAGTPTATLGIRTFTVTATDAIGATSFKTFQLTINAALTTTQAIPSKVGSQGTAIPSFIPVTAAGGTAPITFGISSPATLTGIGLVFDVNTGAVSGTPTGPLALTTFTVTATDAIGAASNKSFTLQVNGPLTTTTAIPAKVGTQGANIPSFIPVTAAGGTAPITFALTGAGDVAALAGVGLTFTAATGAINGTPTAPLATRAFTVTATDGAAATSSSAFNLTINPPLTTTQAVPTTTVTQGTLITPFTPVTAAGGTVPITFTLTGAGDVAALAGVGLTFTAATGAVSGTPTAPLAARSFTVTATDAASATSSKTFTLTVNGPVTTTLAIPSKIGDDGTAIPSFIPVTAAGGTAPIAFALTGAGDVAALAGVGLTFTPGTGAISGTPTAPLALRAFTVTATDAVGSNSSKSFNLTINSALTTTQAIPTKVGDNGVAIPSFTPVTAAGGTAPITFALTGAGDVAALAGVGLTFTAGTGAINGTPTATLGIRTFTVTATDNIGATSAKSFQLTINATLTTTQAVPSKVGTQGTLVPDFIPVTSAGGTAPVTFALSPLATLTGIGMTFDVSTGTVGGTPSGPLSITTFTVTATDAIGANSNKTFTLLVNGPLTTTLAVPAKVGTQGANIPSFIPVTAAGGTGTITFALTGAGDVAAFAAIGGLTFTASTGAISGTPTNALATRAFTVTATDGVAATSSQTFNLTVNTALTTTLAVPATTGDVGTLVPTFTPVTAAGGTAPTTFALTGAGDVAALAGTGLTFTGATGAVSGTPTGTLATRSFTVTATDAAGATSSKSFSLTINSALTTTQAVPAKVGVINTAIPSFIPVTAAGGTAPRTFALVPLATLTGTGLVFDVNTGAVSGTPTSTLAITTFTVTATDAIGVTSSKTFDLTINATPPGIVMAIGATPTATASVAGGTISIPVIVDMTNRGTDDMGSVQLTITWDPTKFSYNPAGETPGNWPGGIVTPVNSSTAGQAQISGFSFAATTSTFTLINISLNVLPAGAGTNGLVTANVTAAANAAAGPITVTPRNLNVTITP